MSARADGPPQPAIPESRPLDYHGLAVKGKKLIVIGDRVLVTPEKGEERTRVGLYLPSTAVEKNAVQGGRIVEVGPGTPMANPADLADEPWKLDRKLTYVPMEAKVGDFALFLRAAAVEIEFEGTKYLIVPHAAILILIREGSEDGTSPDAGDFREEDFKV